MVIVANNDRENKKVDGYILYFGNPMVLFFLAFLVMINIRFVISNNITIKQDGHDLSLPSNFLWIRCWSFG